MQQISDGQLHDKQSDKVEALIERERRWTHKTDFTIGEFFFFFVSDCK